MWRYNHLMIDLHVHLDGSLIREEVVALAALSGLDIEEAKKAPLSVDPSCASLNEYIACCDYPLEVMQTAECIEKAVYMLLARLYRSGLLYAEIRFAPQLHTRRGLSQDEVVQAAIAGLNKVKEEYSFPAQLILCVMRGSDNEKANFETVEVARRYYKKGVCALDLAGAEAVYRTIAFASVFQKANEYALPFTIHAGEVGGPESVWEAIKMGAKRIGHGVRAVSDPLLISFLAGSGISFELCPTSEVDTHAIPSYEALPIRKFMEKGILFNINTDDMTISNITLDEEFAKLQKTFHFSDETLKKFYLNAVEMAFLESDQKDFLKEEIERIYEKKEG